MYIMSNYEYFKYIFALYDLRNVKVFNGLRNIKHIKRFKKYKSGVKFRVTRRLFSIFSCRNKKNKCLAHPHSCIIFPKKWKKGG